MSFSLSVEVMANLLILEDSTAGAGEPEMEMVWPIDES